MRGPQQRLPQSETTASCTALPTELVARTTNIYAVPLVSPLIVAVVDDPPTSVEAPPGLATTLYLVMGLPPLLAGAAQVTTAELSPLLAPTPVGLPGAVGVGPT